MSRQSVGIPLECDEGDLTIGGTAVTATATELNTLDGVLTGSATWDPGSVADGAEVANDFTVTGAALGDFAIAGAGVDVTDLVVSATVTAANTVTVVLSNQTTGAVDLASSTWNILVIKA